MCETLDFSKFRKVAKIRHKSNKTQSREPGGPDGGCHGHFIGSNAPGTLIMNVIVSLPGHYYRCRSSKKKLGNLWLIWCPWDLHDLIDIGVVLAKKRRAVDYGWLLWLWFSFLKKFGYLGARTHLKPVGLGWSCCWGWSRKKTPSN